MAIEIDEKKIMKSQEKDEPKIRISCSIDKSLYEEIKL